MLSAFDEFPLVKQAFKKGAADYVLKQEIVPARMLELVREARAVSYTHLGGSLGDHVRTVTVAFVPVRDGTAVGLDVYKRQSVESAEAERGKAVAMPSAAMSEFMSYDPWAEITTRNGYAGAEMVAMLQTAIRRGKEEDALHAAYEMYITSPQFEEKLWRRLLCISVDVRFLHQFDAAL